MGEARPHRPALPASEIARHLVAEVEAGQLDREAVDAVLQAMGAAERAAPAPSAQLTERELDVARLLARGKTNNAIGAGLGISGRTVQIHVAHIYKKIGVSSRAGAAVWLMENDLLRARSQGT
jgi:DNA-binding NarL/FixJ family response regulator